MISETPPAWFFPMLVRPVDGIESERETFVDRRSIVYVFRGKHAFNGNVEAQFTTWPLRPEGLYLRTTEGLYRKVGGPSSIEQVAARLPPTFVPTLTGRILANLTVARALDGPSSAHVRRLGYRLRMAPGGPFHLEWIHISRRCLAALLPRVT